MALFALTMIVYLPVLGHGFLRSFDDAQYVTDNLPVRRGLSAQSFCWAWTSFCASNWHPLTWLSHMLDCQLFGLEKPGGHHLVNLLLHTANTLILFLVLQRMTGAAWRSSLVAALFAVHPLHVESVAWVAERKDVLSVFFGLLALAAYVRYAERPGVVRYLFVTGAFVLSLLSKPMLVTLPCLLLLLDYWPLRRWAATPPTEGPPRPRFRLWVLVLEKVPLFALAAASCVVTVLAQMGQAVVAVERLPLDRRVGNALLAYVAYLRKTVWPADLAVFYPYSPHAPPSWQIVVAGIFLAALTAAAFFMRRRRPALLVGWLWFVGTLVPVIGLVQVGGQAMADRYTYFPLIGLFMALAWAVPAGNVTLLSGALHPPIGRVAFPVAAGGVLTVCAVLTWMQLAYWADEEALWCRALAVNEENAVAHVALGIVIYPRGEVDEAERHFLRGMQLAPNYDLAYSSLGTSRLRQGQVDQALALFESAASASPATALHRNNLGLAFLRKGRADEAARCFREAIRLEPATAEYHCNLAAVLDEQGEGDAAREQYREGLRLDADWPERMRLLADALRATRIPQMRCPAEALFRVRQANVATEGRRPEMLDALAAAYDENDDLAAALNTEMQAMAAAVDRPDLARLLQEKARGYEARLSEKKTSGTKHIP